MPLKSLLFIVLFPFIVTASLTAQDKNLVFSRQHGFCSEPFDLRISSPVTGAKIRYTLNGTNPAKVSFIFEADSPALIHVDPSLTAGRDKAPGFIVTAYAVVNDTAASKVVTQTYLFLNKITELSSDNLVPGPGWPAPPSVNNQMINYGLDSRIYNDASYKPQINSAFTSIPTLSLVTDLKNLFQTDSGIYVNAFKHSEDWEREVSLELLNPDSSQGFQIFCGLRIRGGWSRHPDNPKHAFRVFFRDEYGKGKLEYPLFGNEGAKVFDKFDLQTSQNYSWAYYGDPNNTFLREIFSRDTQRDMMQPYTRGRFFHLYINGSYWGLYQIQERSEASFGETYFGLSKEDYDVIKVDVGENFDVYKIEATGGTLDKWRELWDAGQTGFASDEVYFKVQGLNTDGTLNPEYDKLLDVDNLIDYMLITFYAGDFDGPISGFRNNTSPNNFFAIYNRVKPDGFKFFRHDAEHTLFFNDWGTDRTGPFTAGTNFMESNPQWIHQKLSDNAHYRLRFADRVYKHFFNNGALTLSKNLERLNKRKQEIETAIIAESARWGDSKVSYPKTKTDWTNAVNFITQSFFPGRNSIVLGQLIKKGLYSNNLPPQFDHTGGIVPRNFNVNLSSVYGKIYYTTDGSDPYLPFADSGSAFSKTVIAPSAAKKVLVPKTDIGVSWRNITFDDSAWLTCSGAPGGVGYETGTGYESLISLSVKNLMYTGASGPNSSCYIRIPFEITSDERDKVSNMTLQVMYDDGFVAYINGIKVAEVNQPQALSWNSGSPANTEADKYYSFDISAFVNYLTAGTNVLAIHGLNYSTSSSDFLILPKLVIGKSAQSDGRLSPSAIEYKNPISISKTTTVKARTLSGTTWSPVNEATFIIKEDLSSLKITELHYHPLGRDTISDKSFEFIELKNCGNEQLVLNGSSFVSGIDYTFGNKTLAPGGFVVLASNKDEFNKRYGFMPYDVYIGQLDNSGEKVAFINAAGDTVFSFTYNDKAPWPEDADGKGYSLVAKQTGALGDPNSPDYWTRSRAINGSPGTDDPATYVSESLNKTITEYRLWQNYPNPFNPETLISYQLPKAGHVELTVYDILGRAVKDLVNSYQPEGVFKVKFNAGNLSSGIYFYRIKTEDFTQTQKMLLMR